MIWISSSRVAKLGIAFLIGVIALTPYGAFADTADAISRAYAEAHAAHAPLRNALQAYLRLAGVVWIAVEWIAAIVLWRVYQVLKQRIVERQKDAQ